MRIFGLFSWYSIFGLLVFVIAIFGLLKFFYTEEPEKITAVVERGDVTEYVSVSGFVEAKQMAELAFPGSGVVTDILVETGSEVESGDILATIAAPNLVAERNAALSKVSAAIAAYDQLLVGPRAEAVTVSSTTLANAIANLSQTEQEEAQKIANARAALLSTGLTAIAVDSNEEGTAPVVSGTYTCETEGRYLIEVYSSANNSGYSYNFSGLENGNTKAATSQPAPLGDCGLYLQFTDGDRYSRSNWIIDLPNTRGANYVTLKNNYDLVLTQAANNISLARNNLTLAEKQQNLTLAPALAEEIKAAEAAINEAKANLAVTEAKLADRSITAPFSGIVTDVEITKGEVANTNPVITLLADDAYELKAQVPEIDISKLAIGQAVSAVFDASSRETILGTISYISPIAKQIDGVAYFEITIKLPEPPTWLRAGLNADIDIIVNRRENVLRLPKRFVRTLSDGSSVVLVDTNRNTATTTIEILFTGNDSFLEVSGLSEGTVVIAP